MLKIYTAECSEYNIEYENKKKEQENKQKQTKKIKNHEELIDTRSCRYLTFYKILLSFLRRNVLTYLFMVVNLEL